MTRRAIIEVVPDTLPEVANVIRDHGLKLRGSIASSDPYRDLVVLILEDQFGDKLPAQCEHGWWLVSMTITQEVYGAQKMTKISAIEAVRKLAFGPALAA